MLTAARQLRRRRPRNGPHHPPHPPPPHHPPPGPPHPPPHPPPHHPPPHPPPPHPPPDPPHPPPRPTARRCRPRLGSSPPCPLLLLPCPLRRPRRTRQLCPLARRPLVAAATLSGAAAAAAAAAAARQDARGSAPRAMNQGASSLGCRSRRLLGGLVAGGSGHSRACEASSSCRQSFGSSCCCAVAVATKTSSLALPPKTRQVSLGRPSC